MNTLVTKDWEIKTVRELIDRMAQAQGQATFLISPETGRVLTFAGLQEQSKAISARLGQAGLTRGDKVAFLADNGLFTVQLFLGTIYGGLVIVPLNVRAGVSQLAYTLDHCDAKAVFVEDQYAALAREALVGISHTVQVIPVNVDDFAANVDTPIEDSPPPMPTENDIALLMYTSGSVGVPKAAIHSHRTLLAHGANSVDSHRLTSADRSLLVLPLYHINAECVTLMPTLLSGGSVVVPHHFNVSQYWDWLDEHRCTWSAVVPTILAQLLDWKDPRADLRKEAFKRVRFIRSSSAPLSPSMQREFLGKFELLLIQAMGSSEAGNIFSNPQPPGENKIGTPGLAWGFETRIVDPEGNAVAVGEPGEVLIRGAAVMQGYYKDPDQTAAVLDAEGWLHTGDLAYQDQEGYFFVVGRSKELIIKGGMNIAPRQIDDVLESHPAVLEAAAVGVRDHYVGEDIVAFAVLRSGMAADEKEMLAFCESRLGHFKTPTRIHFVPDLPKGPSGKIQRLRLLDEAGKPATAALANGNGHVADSAPSATVTLIEQTITQSWAEVLEQPRIDPDSNFFSLGGHSLMAIQCLSRMRDKLPVMLSLSDFFENPTVAQQVALVRYRLSGLGRNGDQTSPKQSSIASEQNRRPQHEASDGSQPILARGRNLPYPLSSGQQRIWFFQELAPGVPLYNECEAVRLSGELHPEAIEQALNLIISRHEMLRSTIQMAAERPIGIVHENWSLRMKRIDLSGLAPAQRDAEVERLLIEEPRLPYHLETEPGIRATMIRLGPTEHVFILMMHHLVCDWASEGILWRELSSAYRAICRGESPAVSRLPIQYGDYAVWQQQRVDESGFAEDLTFWENNLRGALELLELPSDRPRPSVQSYRGARQRFRLNPALTEALRNCSRQEKTSLFTVFAAALNSLLYRYTGSEDILLGIPIAEREQRELQSVIGFLIHTQALRTAVSGSMTFRELLGRVQKGTVALYGHREVPFDLVVTKVRPERSLSHSPLFQVMINWRDQDQHLSFIGLNGLVVESLLGETRTSKFDLTLFLTDFGNEIWMEAEYNTDLFDEDRIARMFSHYATLLEAVAARPDRCLAELPLLTDTEREQLLVEWNPAGAVHPHDACIHQLFELQAQRTPDAVAVTYQENNLTYRELNQRSNQLAHYLQEMGVKAGELVGICMERSLEMMVGVLGILKAGGAYLPLDPSYPEERLVFTLGDARARLLVTQSPLLEKVSGSESRMICLDRDRAEIERQSVQNPRSEATADDLAYVIYTSGSTGKPKGVEITHYNVTRLLKSTEHWIQFDQKDVWSLFHSFAFDFSVWEIWGALLYGGRLLIVPYMVSRSPEAMYDLLSRERVTVLNQTPSAFLQLVDHEVDTPEPKELALRLVIFGGEALNMSSLAPWFERHGDDRPQLVNMYGITETTVHVTYRPVKKADLTKGSLIGQPIPDLQVYILDEHQRPVPIGIPGEICVGGAGLARGYLNRPDLTALRFIADPFSSEPNARLYRSGDLARYMPDGDIEYLGRIDQQVKIRGFRIELGEIEAILRQHLGVAQCAVVAREDQTGDKQLVAYFVPIDQQGAPTVEQLRDLLKQKLPEYMLPAAFVMLDKLPLTSNGKLDRKALPAPESGRAISESTYVAPRTPMEEALADIWRKGLGLKQIGIRDDFFALGGHSFQATRLIAKVHKSLNYKLSVPVFFQNPTIEGLARVLEEEKQPEADNQLIPLEQGNAPGTLFFLNAEIGLCRIARLLKSGPTSFATLVALPDDTLRAAAQNRVDELPSVESLAAEHVALIRTHRRPGPVLLAGHSFGGTLAFEVAHQLRREGIPVEMILLLDSWATSPLWWQRLRALSFNRVRRSISFRASHWRSRIRTKMQEVNKLITTASGSHSSSSSAPSNMPLDEVPGNIFGWVHGWVYANIRKNYRYLPLDSRGVLFQCGTYNNEMGWKGLFTRGLEVMETPGDHFSLLDDFNGKELAQRIDHFLELLNAREVRDSSPISSWRDAEEISASARAKIHVPKETSQYGVRTL